MLAVMPLAIELLRKSAAGVLNAAVAVMDQSAEGLLALQSALQGRGGQFTTEIFAAMVSEDLAAAGVDGESEAEPALFCFDGGEVALPDLVRRLWRRHFWKKVWGGFMGMATVGSARPIAALLFCAQAGLAHQSSDAILAAAMTPIAQLHAQPR
jgi:hypothetical protein